MSLFETFMWGFSGSIAVEIANIYQVFQDENSKMPSRYKSFWFWCVRLILAIIAGGLAMAYKIDSPILAANIGASAPLILQALSQGVRPPTYQALEDKSA